MAEKKQEEPTNTSKSLTDSDTSDDTKVNPRLRTSIEERDPRISHCNLHSKSDGRVWTPTPKSKD